MQAYNPEAATGAVMYKQMFFEISQNSQESTCTRASPVPKTFNFIKKETLAQVFSCEFRETFENTVSAEHLRTTVSYNLQFVFKIADFTDFATAVWSTKSK